MEIAEIRQQFPMYGDMSDDQLLAGLHQRFYSDIPVREFMKQVQLKAPDPTEGMSGTKKFLSGTGKAFADIGRGVGQITGLTPQSSIDEAKRLDQPLMKTGAGVAGNVVGNAALFAPTAAIPGANTLTGAGLIGAAAGALQPVASGESRGLNTVLGGAGGVAGQALGSALGRAITPVSSKLNPEMEQLAQSAGKEGIPLTVGQRTGSRPLQIAESVMENLPFTSAPQLASKEAQQRAFTSAALRRAGMSGDVASAPAMLNQKKDLGGILGSIAEKGTLDFNQGLTDRLATIVGDANQHLPPDLSSKVSSMVDKVLSQVDKSGSMAGTNYQGWREPLRGLASNTETGRYYQQIRQALDEAFRTQLPGAEGDLYRNTSRQYANLKTIIDAMGGAGNLPSQGQIAPAQLSAALARAIGRQNKALGGGDMNELARVGQTFVKDQIPNSGTAQREFIQNMLTGNISGAAAGAGLGYYEGGDLKSAGIGALGGAGAALGGPRLAQAILQNPTTRKYIQNQALTPAMRKLLTDALRTGAISSVPALTSQ